MTSSRMSYNNSSSVDRDLLRELQRQARAQLVDNTKDAPANPAGLFPEPIKVAPVSDDPLGKRIKKTLGEYDAMKETISNNPKNLIGITRQPHTPLPSVAHHDAPLFPDLHKPPKPPYLNGQHKHGSEHTRNSSSRGSGRDVEGRNKVVGNAEFNKPKAVSALPSSSTSLPSSSTTTTTTSLTASAFHQTSSGHQGPQEVVGKSEASRSLPPPPSSSSSSSSLSQQLPVATLPSSSVPSQPLASSRQPSPPVKEKSSRDRSSCQPPHHMPFPLSSSSSSSSITSSSTSSKYQPSSSTTSAIVTTPSSDGRLNGMVFNGSVKSAHSRPSGPKTNLRLQIDSNQMKSHLDHSDLDTIMKEMIAPTPLTGIPTPRKEESRFPFVNAGSSQVEGKAPLSTSTKSVNRTLDLDSQPSPVEKQLGSAPNSADDILNGDLEISSESEDEITSALRTTASGSGRSPGQAVLTNPPPAIAAMSATSESSSSDSEDSSSGSDSDDNSNKSHSNSEASDPESRPESPKPEMKWYLDAFAHPSSSVPFDLPSDPSAVADQESQSFDVGFFASSDRSVGGSTGKYQTADRSREGDDPSEYFSKEDIKDLILSPAPQPLESIVDPLDRTQPLVKLTDDVPPKSTALSPPLSSNSRTVQRVSKKPSSAPSARKRSPASTFVSREKVSGSVVSKEKSRAIRKALGKNGLSKSTTHVVHDHDDDDDGGGGGNEDDSEDDDDDKKEVETTCKAPKSSCESTVLSSHKKDKSSLGLSANRLGGRNNEGSSRTKKVSECSVGSTDSWKKSNKEIDGGGDSRRSLSPTTVTKEPAATTASILPMSSSSSSVPKTLARQDSNGSLKSGTTPVNSRAVSSTTISKSSHAVSKSSGSYSTTSSLSKIDKKSAGSATPTTSSVKKGGSSEKRSRSQISHKIKSKEYISDCGGSDSEDEIDVVGTPSPVKIASEAKHQSSSSSSSLATSIADTIAAVSAGAGTVKSFSSPHHRSSHSQRPRSSKHHRDHHSKEKEQLVATSHSSVVLGSAEVAASHREKRPPDTIGKSCPVPGVGDVITSLRFPQLTYKNGLPSLMVNVDLALLDRIPLCPTVESLSSSSSSTSKELRKGVAPCIVPSKGRVSKESSSGSGDRRPPPTSSSSADPVAAAKAKTKSLASSSSIVTDAKAATSPSLTSTKTPSSDKNEGRPNKRPAGDADQVKLEKKLRPSKDPAGPLPSSSSTSVSPSPLSIKGHKSKTSEVRTKTNSNEMSKGDLVKKDRTESKHSRLSSHPTHQSKDSSTERKSGSSSLSSTTSKRDKKSDLLKESSAKTSRGTSDDQEHRLKEESRDILEMDGRVKGDPDDLATDSKTEVELSKNSGKMSSSCGSSVTSIKKEQSSLSGGAVIKKEHETATATTITTCSSLGSTHGPSSKPKDSKHRSRDAGKELDVKRRKHDVTPSSQTSMAETPKTSGEGIERNTNHDRIPVVEDPGSSQRTAASPSFLNGCKATLEKIDSEINMRQQMSDYYLQQAKNLKHEADKEPDRTIQALKYLHAVLYFILTGTAMESEHLAEKLPFMMYKNTLDLIKFIASKFRYHQSASQNGSIDGKLAVLSLWCQSILFLKLFNMRKNEVRDCQRTLMDYEKTPAGRSTSQPTTTASPCQPSVANPSAAPPPSLWNSKTTGTPSPMSPLPSPAGSVGSVESQSSGYSSSEIGSQTKASCATTSSSNAAALTNPAAHASQFSTVSVPVHIHSTMQKQLTNLNYLASCHDLWEQAESLITRGRIQDFFEILDQLCGRLTLHSPLKDLVRYVMLGLHCLNVEV